MAAADAKVSGRRAPRRFDAGTEEFSRLVKRSDAVFAIAMTLLVLGLEAPDVRAGDLAGVLLEQSPQLVAFVLAFGLTANLWWQHHKLFSRLRFVDAPMVVLSGGAGRREHGSYLFSHRCRAGSVRAGW